MILLLLLLVVVVAAALYVLGPAVRHLHLPGCSTRRALAQVDEPKIEGDMRFCAQRSVDGMASRLGFAHVRDTVRHRSRLRTNAYGARVEIRVVAPNRTGLVFGPKRFAAETRPVLELEAGVWVTPCDAAGCATGLPRRVSE